MAKPKSKPPETALFSPPKSENGGSSGNTWRLAAAAEPIRHLAPDGSWVGPKGGAGLAPEQLLALYRGMVHVRVLDGRMLALQRQGRIGFYGQSTGQ